MKAGRTDAQHPALHNDRPETAMSKNERVLQLDAFAKYAVAFSRMSRSILTRANSARRRLISICSGVTGLMSAPVSLPWRCALTQLNKVWSDIPSERAGSGSKRQACINQSHGLKLELEGVFNAVCLGLSHVVSLRLLRHLARDTFFRGKVSPQHHQPS
ncbi:hypothetical protein BV321_05185 [Pseudomonas syringae pv. actinidiae]|nr:hypothetical protein BV361_03682 [Pseudomonas syringae pv. actinidiae]OSR32040.1 hypothetical protein BV321_05185 [Pseudomonas syringae pv. actinidiae]OSR48971.1 hypothetical protein BV324_05134 [Pseudomonas syringae pv. actinidiae]BBM06819.1 hypothetical protein KPSA3_100509 [Pseudomonas syringae pv. actinidiae]